MIRPESFRLNPSHHIAKGLVFAGLGFGARALTMYDSSLRGDRGTLVNMDPAMDWLWAPEIGRWCLSFDGSTHRVALGSAPAIGTGDFCASAWVRASLSASRSVLSWGMYAPVLAVKSTYTPYLYWGGDKPFSLTIGADAWTHLAVVRRSGVCYCYVDGEEDPTTQSIATAASTASFQIGADRSTGGPFTWPGLLADVGVWTRAVSPGEISELADPSNTMLSGMLVDANSPTTRPAYVSAAPPATAYPAIHYARMRG